VRLSIGQRCQVRLRCRLRCLALHAVPLTNVRVS
jgi:hypothetical protein